MKPLRFFIFIFFFVISSLAGAQPSGFIYIQSEINLPYQVQCNGNNYSSSPGGYLLVQQVPAGEQTLVITFSPEISVAYSFTIAVTEKPRGFSLRQAINNSWSLFDMIDFTTQKGTVVAKIVKPEPIQSEPVLIVEKKPADSATTKPTETALVKKEDSLTKKEPVGKAVTGLQKILDKSGPSGIDQVYIIINGGKADTVAIFIQVLTEDEPKAKSSTGSQSAAVSGPGKDRIEMALAFIHLRLRNPLRSK